jgi:hypothetical protein
MRSCGTAPTTPLAEEHNNDVDGDNPYKCNCNYIRIVYDVLEIISASRFSVKREKGKGEEVRVRRSVYASQT